MTDSQTASRVLVRTEGALGRLTLDRPEAINALDIGMIEILTETLNRWREDTDVQIVLIDGAGERGLGPGQPGGARRRVAGHRGSDGKCRQEKETSEHR